MENVLKTKWKNYNLTLAILYSFFCMLHLECKLEEPVEELPPLRVKDLPMIKTEEPEKYYELLRMFVKETKGSLRVIWNSFEELESSALTTLSQEFSIPMFPIGPFHKYSPSSLLIAA